MRKPGTYHQQDKMQCVLPNAERTVGRGETKSFTADGSEASDVYSSHIGRVPLRLPVQLHKERRLLGSFVTRDIDQAGVFIEAINIDVYPEDILELVFRHTERGSREHSLRATVMRLETDGIGLMFLERDGNTVVSLLAKNRLI